MVNGTHRTAFFIQRFVFGVLRGQSFKRLLTPQIPIDNPLLYVHQNGLDVFRFQYHLFMGFFFIGVAYFLYWRQIRGRADRHSHRKGNAHPSGIQPEIIVLTFVVLELTSIGVSSTFGSLMDSVHVAMKWNYRRFDSGLWNGFTSWLSSGLDIYELFDLLGLLYVGWLFLGICTMKRVRVQRDFFILPVGIQYMYQSFSFIIANIMNFKKWYSTNLWFAMPLESHIVPVLYYGLIWFGIGSLFIWRSFQLWRDSEKQSQQDLRTDKT